jgi:MFS family permease
MRILANECLGSKGLVTNYAGLAAVRACMGLAEGPMGPCIVCYLSGFYTRKELSLRFASPSRLRVFGIILVLELPYFFQSHRWALIIKP